MHTMTRNGDRFEAGALFYHSHYRHSVELMKALNLYDTKRPIKGHIQFARKDGTGFKYNHKIPYMSPLGLAGNFKMFWFILKEIILKKRDPLNKIRNSHPEWDDICVLDYWKSGSRSDRALRDFVVTPASVATNDGWPEYLNLAHFIHCMRIDTFTDFFALAGGTSSLTDALARRLEVRYENPVNKLVVEKNRVTGVQMESTGEIRPADHVIVAVAPPFVSKLLPEGELTEQGNCFNQVLLNPYPVAIFHLGRHLDKNVWAYFSDMSERKTFTWAVDHCSKTPDGVPGAKSILTVYSAHPVTLELIKKSDEEILKIAREDVETFIPGFSNYIEEEDLHRHAHAVSRYPVGSYRLATEIKEKQVGNGVSFITDFTGGGYIEAALDSARTAVDNICRILDC